MHLAINPPVPLGGEIESLRSKWKNDTERYIPMVYIDGEEVQIQSYTFIDQNLEIYLNDDISQGSVVEIPVLITTLVSQDNTFCVREKYEE